MKIKDIAKCGHEGPYVVYVEAWSTRAQGYDYHVYGAGSSVEDAVTDAEEHAFAALGKDASLGDWAPA